MEDYLACKAFRESGHHEQAWEHYKRATQSQPELLSADLKLLLAFEASILLFYVSDGTDRRRGLQASYDVLRSDTLDASTYHCVHANLVFYTLPIGGDVVVSKPKVHQDTGYFYTTPSFCGDKDVVYRLVNYEIADNGAYVIHDDANVVRTQNLWEGRGLLRELPVTDPTVPRQDNMPVCGLEDLRLSRPDDNGKIYALASSWEYSRAPRAVSQCLLEVDETSLGVTVLAVLNDGNRCEKNWCWAPGYPYIVYDWYPFVTILKVSHQEENGVKKNWCVVPHKKVCSSPLMRFFRGSSNGVLYEDEMWFVTHTVVDSRGPIRRYLHYFVVMDGDLNRVLKVSYPFVFEIGADIEFCTSLYVDSTGVTMAYSVRDGNPKIRVVDWDSMNN